MGKKRTNLFSNSNSSKDFDSSFVNIWRTLSPVIKRNISDIAYSVCSSSEGWKKDRKKEKERNKKKEEKT